MTDKHQEIMNRQDAAYTSGQHVREKSADDLLFSRLTQWDDTVLDFVGTEYRGEFNLIRRERRRLISEMRASPVQVDFKPVDGADPDAADILNGMYRTDMRNNRSKEAVDVAVGDQIDAGFGAWRLVTEYISNGDDLDNRQVVRRVPIHEGNNVVFFDPNAKRMDKSDAMWCSIIACYTKEGYENLADELGFDVDLVSNFGTPQTSYTFPWSYGDKSNEYNVGEYYERVKFKERLMIMDHPIKGQVVYKRSELKDVMDDMLDQGWRVMGQKTRERFRVDKYIVSGATILKGPERIAGEHIPVVPVYGEWFYVEGVECWEGITRLAKDPQRLYNMQMSYLADIAAKGPRRKPIFSPEQVQGFEHMWEQGNNAYPYYLMNRKTVTGEDLPVGPMSYIEPEQIPQATAALLDLTRRNVEDVTSPSMPQNAQDPNGSGRAILAVQSRIDMQSFVYMDNLSNAMRRDGEIYQSMAREIYDTPQTVTLTGLDGTESSADILEEIMDMATGEMVTLNDLSRGSFQTYVDVGPSYQSQKQQARSELMELYRSAPDPQTQQILLMQYISMQEGAQMEMMRKYATRQLLKMGIKEPENEEEEAYVQQLQQSSQEPDPTTQATLAALMAQAGKDESMAVKYQADAIRSGADAEKMRAETAEILVQTDAKEIEAAIKLSMALRGGMRG
jgi:hypothetical protein